MVMDVDTSPRSMPSNSRLMSSKVLIETPTRPTSPACHRVVWVQPDLGWQIEGHRQPRLTTT